MKYICLLRGHKQKALYSFVSASGMTCKVLVECECQRTWVE